VSRRSRNCLHVALGAQKINAGAAAVTSEQTMIAANLLFDNTTVLDNP